MFIKLLKRNKRIFSVFMSIVMLVTVCSPTVAFAESDTNVSNYSQQTANIDEMLLISQEWLNDTFGKRTGYNIIPEDGTSRRATVNGCIRALQVHLGITDTADNFGPTTIRLFNQMYPNGVVQQEYPSKTENEIYGIIQCALWTKGYYIPSGSITEHFYDGTRDAIKELKTDMGFIDPNSTVTLDVMKGLLSMDQYKKLSNGNDNIRTIQQSLNREYGDYIGIIPCDGVAGRQLSTAMIKALQSVEGYSVEDATGNFGNGTKEKLPILPDTNNVLSQETEEKAIVLLKYALCWNGYDTDFSTSFDNQLIQNLTDFQTRMALPVTKIADVNTWMSLFTSKGNPDRSAIACDTRFEMTQDRIDYLKQNGYQIVGRYLTGSEKGLKDDEPERIINNGLSFFPIFQETLYTDSISKYNYDLGREDARKAIIRASELYIPDYTVIYFAIDFDPTDDQIENYVLPYFEGIKREIGTYHVGVYGTRNTCQKVMSHGYAETCFVSDMSTGYSGNMGFVMPDNWNLDQFYEYSVTTSSGTWDIDKVAYSGKFPTVDYLQPTCHKYIPQGAEDYFLGEFEFTENSVGNFFTPYGTKLSYKIIWEIKTEDHLFTYFDVVLLEYLSKVVDRRRGIPDTTSTYSTFISDEIDITSGVDYRFSYSASSLDTNIPGKIKAKVYISTK